MTQYGYIRVSTKEQNTDRQLDALIEAGIEEENIFTDHQSGKDFERPEYQKLMQTLQPKDILFIKSIDRLGRNYDEIIEQWRTITKEKDADVVILDMPLLDTRSKERDLTGTFIADLVLQILSYVATVERDNIKKRQAEGIAAARRRGVHLGRLSKPIPDNFVETVKEWKSGEISRKEALYRLGVGKTYFYEKIKELGL